MRAINAIIITSGLYATTDSSELDATIESILNVGKSPILVLGPDGDDWLSSSRLIDRCEMVFDPNFEGGFFSGVKAGLHATYGPAFILRVGDRAPAKKVWDDLERAAFSPLHAKSALVSISSDASAIHLVTLHGIDVLKSLSADSSWDSVIATQCRTIESLNDSHADVPAAGF